MRTAKIGPDLEFHLLQLVHDLGRFVRHTYYYEQLIRGYQRADKIKTGMVKENQSENRATEEIGRCLELILFVDC